MIPKEISEKLRRGLGPDYLYTVHEGLKKKNATTRTGKPYGKTYISAVLSGDRDIPVIEEEIFEAYTGCVQQIVRDAREMGVPIPEPEI